MSLSSFFFLFFFDVHCCGVDRRLVLLAPHCRERDTCSWCTFLEKDEAHALHLVRSVALLLPRSWSATDSTRSVIFKAILSTLCSYCVVCLVVSSRHAFHELCLLSCFCSYFFFLFAQFFRPKQTELHSQRCELQS